MSAKGQRRMQVVIPFQERFCFTRGDVEAMRSRMNAFLLNNHPPAYREHREARAYNNRVIGKRLWALYTGHVSRTSSPAFLRRVYEAARVAHANALRLQKSEEEARRSAIVYAQLIIEREIGFYEGPSLANVYPSRHFKTRH